MSDTLTDSAQAKAVPSPYLTIKNGEQEAKLFMSFGLLDELLSFFEESGTGAEQAAFDRNQRNAVLKMVLAKNPAFPEYGLQEEFDPKTSQITPETGVEIFGWVLDHSTYFFLRNAEATQRIGEKYKERTGFLTPSQSGSKV